MRRRWKSALGCVALAVASLCGSLVAQQPAGATVWYDVAWHAGRGEYAWYGNGGFCTAGPQYYSWTNNRYMMAMPRHCFEVNYNDGSFGTYSSGFMSRWENSNTNKFDGNQVAFRTNGAYPANIDVVLIDIAGTSGEVASRSNYQFNYCDIFHSPLDCSSWLGGGAGNNGNWEGFYNTIVANGWPAANQYSCKHGGIGGTACGVGNPNAGNGTYNGSGGWSSPVSYITSLNNCKMTLGDSGSPVIATGTTNALTTNVTGLGMLVGVNGNPSSGPPCYSAGKLFWYGLAFIQDADIRSAFSAFGLQLLQW